MMIGKLKQLLVGNYAELYIVSCICGIKKSSFCPNRYYILYKVPLMPL